MLDLFDVTGRVALVTGSSRGIGKALATGLLDAGAVVVLNARGQDQLAATRDELVAAHANASIHAVPFDGTDAAEVARGIDVIESDVGPIDILVNNTGMQHRAPFVDFPEDVWHALLATNLTSAFLVGREVARRMTPRGCGKIVNICSVQSMLVRPGIAPYSATKGALAQLTKGMCADLGPAGIQVNAIAPGYFRTELTAPLVQDEAFTSWVEGHTPAGRWGDVEDLVGALRFFSSAGSDFVTGQILYVDGGMTCVL
ncbi:MAG: SDR family oxidoreductase [Ornithinimicrobium sp.]